MMKSMKLLILAMFVLAMGMVSSASAQCNASLNVTRFHFRLTKAIVISSM
jgi:hypothetical protein